MRRARVRSSERGAAAVEFAVLLPVLLAILCGTIDWGYYFFTREVVVNASREGARVGTLQFGAGVSPGDEAREATLSYLDSAFLDRGAAKVRTDVNRDGGACPANASCVQVTYENGGSITGFLRSFIPTPIVAYAQMRR